MSIILDALKKAEKDRTEPMQGAPTGITTDDVVFQGKMSARPKVLVILLLLSVGIFLGVRYLPKLLAARHLFPVKNKVATVVQNVPVNPAQIKKEKQDQADALREKVDNLKGEAIHFFEEGNLDKSLDSWKNLVDIAPNDAEIYNNMGVVYKKMDKPKQAEEAYEKALELNDDYPEALNNKGILLMEAFDYDAAKENFLKAAALDSTYGDPHFHLASLFEKEDNLQAAIKHYEDFIRLSSDVDPDLKRKIDLRIDILNARLEREGTH